MKNKHILFTLLIIIILFPLTQEGLSATNPNVEKSDSPSNETVGTSISIVSRQADLQFDRVGQQIDKEMELVSEKLEQNLTQLRKDIELEREYILQKGKTYDSMLITTQITISVFAILFTIIIGIAGFLGYKNIRELKEEVKQKLSEDAHTIIKELMKTQYSNTIDNLQSNINRIENYLKDLKRAIETQSAIPEFTEEIESLEERPKNIFEEE